MLNIFHQLFKKVVTSMYIFQWLKTSIRAKFKRACIKVNIIKLLQQANKIILLDQYFCVILFYLILKIFKKYSKIKQWDGSKYWVVCCQLVFIVIFLLIKDDLIIL